MGFKKHAERRSVIYRGEPARIAMSKYPVTVPDQLRPERRHAPADVPVLLHYTEGFL